MERKPHYEGLHGYTLPLTIKALEKIGLPLAILKVPDEDQRGPLIVTLALELACVLVGLLYQSLAIGDGTDELAAFVMIFGGDEFQREKRQVDLLQRRLIRFGAGELVDKKTGKGKFTRCLGEGFIAWSGDSKKASSQVEEWCKEYSKLEKEYRKISRSLASAEAHLTLSRLQILSAENFQEAYKIHQKSRGITAGWQSPPQKKISINFDEAHPLLQEGAAAIVRNTDPVWWNGFKRFITSKVKSTSNAGDLGLLMRDPLLLRNVRFLETKGNWWSRDALIEILNDPKKPPKDLRKILENEIGQPITGNLKWKKPAVVITKSNLGFRASMLRQEDKSSLAWVKAFSGNHPIDWLVRWSDNDNRSLKKLQREYPAERALNELYWCLTQGSGMTFTPILSNTYPKKKWEAWQRQAQLGSTPFWVRR